MTSVGEGGSASGVTATAADVVDEGRRLPEVSKSPTASCADVRCHCGQMRDFLNRLLSAGIDGQLEAPRDPIAPADRARARVLDLCTGTADLAIAARARRGHPAARRGRYRFFGRDAGSRAGQAAASSPRDVGRPRAWRRDRTPSPIAWWMRSRSRSGIRNVETRRSGLRGDPPRQPGLVAGWPSPRVRDANHSEACGRHTSVAQSVYCRESAASCPRHGAAADIYPPRWAPSRRLKSL